MKYSSIINHPFPLPSGRAGVGAISSFIHHSLILLAAVLLTSCIGLVGLLDDDDSDGGGTTSTQSVSVSAEKQDKSVTLSGLKSAIDSAVKESGANWLTATPQSYVSGSPTIIISVAANTTTSTRSATVTVKDTKKNTVTLTVTQQGIKGGIDNIHNTDTNQPAYAPM